MLYLCEMNFDILDWVKRQCLNIYKVIWLRKLIINFKKVKEKNEKREKKI